MDQTKDMNYCKSYYAFKAPPMASDRDFLMEMQLWHDFPEKNMMCAHMKSIKDERMPDRKGRVRADCHIMSVIGKPDKDAQGNDITHCMLVTCIDINGLVPKWMVNIAC